MAGFVPALVGLRSFCDVGSMLPSRWHDPIGGSLLVRSEGRTIRKGCARMARDRSCRGEGCPLRAWVRTPQSPLISRTSRTIRIHPRRGPRRHLFVPRSPKPDSPSCLPTSDHIPPRSFPRPSSSRVPRSLPSLSPLLASLGPYPVEEIRPPLQVFLALAMDVHKWCKRRWTNIAANTSSQRHQRRTQACRARACGRADVHRRA